MSRMSALSLRERLVLRMSIPHGTNDAILGVRLRGYRMLAILNVSRRSYYHCDKEDGDRCQAQRSFYCAFQILTNARQIHQGVILTPTVITLLAVTFALAIKASLEMA